MNRADRIKRAEANSLKTQRVYEGIIDEMANIRLNKVMDYGEDRYKIDDLDFDMAMCYSDIWRKFIRIKNLIVNKVKILNVQESIEDTLLDLANYCIMAVQILRSHNDKN
jgi:hypothetical protein